MILIKDVPLVPLQQAVFKVLKDGQKVAVYGDVTEDAKLPYITIGSVTAKPLGAKDKVLWSCAINVDVWADRNQRKEVNEIINDISVLLSYYGPSLAVEGFKTMSASIDLVEAFPEQTTGYHGTLSASFELQKFKEE